jgi:hypothetical protein
MHWILMWSSLESTERQEDLATKYKQLEKVAGDLYNQCSWRFDLRLTCQCRVTSCFLSLFRWLIHVSILYDP